MSVARAIFFASIITVCIAILSTAKCASPAATVCSGGGQVCWSRR